MSLRRRLAEHGYESNEDYEFALKALFEARLDHLRCLHVDGEPGRRKTALANALVQALAYPHVVYHDCSLPEMTQPAVIVTRADGEPGEPLEPGLTRFERALTEACAYSEAARTVLIVDQLQAAEFRDQLRLAQFVATREWSVAQSSVRANPRHLLVVLISEATLYHPLARSSFRVWAGAGDGAFAFRPQDFALGSEFEPLFRALATLFGALGRSPTASAFARILDDLQRIVRSEAQLRQSIFGWMEGADRDALAAAELRPALRQCISELGRLLGVEELELSDSA